VPNTYDQIAQTQHQSINTLNFAPTYSRVVGTSTLFTANAFVRRDHITYDPSADPIDDTPASIRQDRTLTNFGVKADVSITSANHLVKFGGTVAATRLHEQFNFASRIRRTPPSPTRPETSTPISRLSI